LTRNLALIAAGLGIQIIRQIAQIGGNLGGAVSH
jgi:hypothetical protein